jgi:hypothetical protein
LNGGLSDLAANAAHAAQDKHITVTANAHLDRPRMIASDRATLPGPPPD